MPNESWSKINKVGFGVWRFTVCGNSDSKVTGDRARFNSRSLLVSRTQILSESKRMCKNQLYALQSTLNTAHQPYSAQIFIYYSMANLWHFCTSSLIVCQLWVIFIFNMTRKNNKIGLSANEIKNPFRMAKCIANCVYAADFWLIGSSRRRAAHLACFEPRETKNISAVRWRSGSLECEYSNQWNTEFS